MEIYLDILSLVKGSLGAKNKSSSNERAWKMQKKWAITDLNAPNGSWDIPSQSQEFEQNRHRHFVGFQPHFHVNMTSQTQSGKTMEKWKCNISAVFCSICLKFCRLLELSKEICLISNFAVLATKLKLLSVIEKTKGLLFKQKCFPKSNLKQYSLIITAGNIIFLRKIDDTLSLLWENNSLLFLNKGLLFLF